MLLPIILSSTLFGGGLDEITPNLCDAIHEEVERVKYDLQHEKDELQIEAYKKLIGSLTAKQSLCNKAHQPKCSPVCNNQFHPTNEQ